MNIIEVMIIGLASALEIASIVLCKGAVFLKISKDKVSKLILIFGSWQIVTLLAGNFLASLIWLKDVTDRLSWLMKGLVIVIFAILAIRMIVKSFHNNFMDEVRDDHLKWSEAWKIASLTGLTSLMAGFAFGCLKTNILIEILVFAIGTIIAVVSGLFIGYRYGYHPKRKGYLFASLVLFAIDIELCCRIFHLI